MSSAYFRQSPASDNNEILLKILDAVEKNTSRMDALSQRFDAIEERVYKINREQRNLLKNVHEFQKEQSAQIYEVSETLSSMQKELHEDRKNGSQVFRNLGENIGKSQCALNEKLVETQRRAEETKEETINELVKLNQKVEQAEKLIQSSWEKVSSMLTNVEEEILKEHENKCKQMEEQFNSVREKVTKNLEQEDEMWLKILQALAEIRKEQDASLIPTSISLGPAEKDEEYEFELVVSAVESYTGGHNAEDIVLNVRLTDYLDNIEGLLCSKLPVAVGHFSDREGSDIFFDKTVEENGIHLWAPGRLQYRYEYKHPDDMHSMDYGHYYSPEFHFDVQNSW